MLNLPIDNSNNYDKNKISKLQSLPSPKIPFPEKYIRDHNDKDKNNKISPNRKTRPQTSSYYDDNGKVVKNVNTVNHQLITRKNIKKKRSDTNYYNDNNNDKKKKQKQINEIKSDERHCVNINVNKGIDTLEDIDESSRLGVYRKQLEQIEIEERLLEIERDKLINEMNEHKITEVASNKDRITLDKKYYNVNTQIEKNLEDVHMNISPVPSNLM